MLRHCSALDRRIGTYNRPNLMVRLSPAGYRVLTALGRDVNILTVAGTHTILNGTNRVHSGRRRHAPGVSTAQVAASTGTAGDTNPKLSITPELREQPGGFCAPGLV